MELLKDYLASRVIADGKRLDDYTRIYFQTNEDLVSCYKNIDFQDQDVLSVLASSDQVFTARDLGAYQVDSFDKNPLSFYYYYLRSWTITYMNQIYPYQILDNDYHFLFELLKQVQPKSEEEVQAFLFWKEHLKHKTDLSRLFFEDTREGKTSFLDIDDLKDVAEDEMEFHKMNFFYPIHSDSSYDIILLSNIIEWARGSNEKILCIRDNLNQLLNSNGIFLCTGLINRYPEKIQREREIFDSNFDFVDYGKEGYVYQKR